jgi:hypothetical protein
MRHQWSPTFYDIELIHKPGNQMLIADLLSRRANHIPKEDNDNKDITVLPQKLFVNLIDIDLQNKITKSRSYDADATSAIKILKKQGPTTLQKNLQEWTTEEHEGNTILFFKGKAYIPKDKELQQEIVRQYHDSRTTGHPGELETFNTIRQHYYWPQMRHYIKKYVEGCMLCQEFKIDRHPANPSLQPIPGSKSPQPFANCSMDIKAGHECTHELLALALTSILDQKINTRTRTSICLRVLVLASQVLAYSQVLVSFRVLGLGFCHTQVFTSTREYTYKYL